jgi:hypothetical protein
MDSGSLMEMVLVDGFNLGNAIRSAFSQSTYRAESWLDQKSRSSSSLSNFGIFSFTVYPSLGPIHIASRDQSNPTSSDGKHRKQHAPRVGVAQGVEAGLVLGVLSIISNHERQIEKDLLTLRASDLVLRAILLGIPRIPIETGTCRQLLTIHSHPALL